MQLKIISAMYVGILIFISVELSFFCAIKLAPCLMEIADNIVFIKWSLVFMVFSFLIAESEAGFDSCMESRTLLAV